DHPSIQNVSQLQESAEGIGMKVIAEKFSDRLLLALGPAASATILLRSPEGEAFRFTGYGFVRRAGQSIIARGKFAGFRLRVEDKGDIDLLVTVNKESATVKDGFLVYGDVPASVEAPAGEGASSSKGLESAESRASIHSYFLPEEVRLKAGGTAREVTVTLRA